MSRPSPPPPPGPRPTGGPFLALLFSGLAALLVIVVSVVFSFGWFVPVIAAIFGLGLFHYLVWGWWLGNIIRDEAKAEAEEEDFWEEGNRLP